MNTRSCRLTVEALEDRNVPSTVAYGDFNKDGLMDMAALTAPTTITVSLAQPDGAYTVSAVLSVPKNQPINSVGVHDFDGDGNLDVYEVSGPNQLGYTRMWPGNGDGTFDSPTTDHWHPHHQHGGLPA